MKICNKCLINKKFLEFNKRKQNKDGYNNKCRSCVKEWREPRKHIEALVCAKYYKKNKIQIIQQQKESSRNKIKYNKEYYQATKNFPRNKANRNATYKAYIQAKQNRTPKWLTKDDYWLMEQAYVVAQERSNKYRIKFHVDHIIPLQGKNVSGFHCPDNLQILPWYENISKSNKF